MLFSAVCETGPLPFIVKLDCLFTAPSQFLVEGGSRVLLFSPLPRSWLECRLQLLDNRLPSMAFHIKNLLAS